MRNYREEAQSDKTLSMGQSNSTHKANWVLTFGDSLTAGYFSRGRKFAPYSQPLQDLLRREPEFKRIIVHENGANGKTGELIHAFYHFKSFVASNNPQYMQPRI